MARVRQRGERDYVHLRNGVYQLRFQYPSEEMRANALLFYGLDPATDKWPKEERRSLKTDIRAVADARAAGYIERHRRFLAFHAALTDTKRSWGDLVFFKKMEPNTQHTLADGTKLVANEDTIMVMEPNGTVTSHPNKVVGGIKLNDEVLREEPAAREFKADWEAKREAAAKDRDAEAIQTYADTLKAKDDGVLTMRVLRKFKTFTDNKPIRECTRPEVIRYIRDELKRHAEGDKEALSQPRLKKGLRYVNAGIGHSKTIDNHSPFKGVESPFVAIPWNDERFLPQHVEKPFDAFSERDVDTIVRNLHLLDDDARLMMVAHIATGARPVGIYCVNRGGWIVESETDGRGNQIAAHRTRYWEIAKDKDKEGGIGKRYIAVPQAVIDLTRDDGTPLVPAEFEGSMFKLDHETILKQCNAFLRKVGVSSEEANKSLYSGRHRASTRFRAVSCPENISEHIMGHAPTKKGDDRRGGNSHRRYGGINAYVMKRWIDHVGCATLKYAEAAE